MHLSVPERAAFVEPDRFWQAEVTGVSRCTTAVHDGMKDLVFAVCVHVFA